MPAPVLEATEATNAAIKDCLEEGCSVEALMELDKKLAKDEATIKKSLDTLHSSQAEEYSEESKEQIAWLSNYLDRSGSLRAQLQAVKTLKAEGDLAAQLVRAASVAFGGGRKGDYPKASAIAFASSAAELMCHYNGPEEDGIQACALAAAASSCRTVICSAFVKDRIRAEFVLNEDVKTRALEPRREDAHSVNVTSTASITSIADIGTVVGSPSVSFAFPRANPGGAAEKMRLAKYETADADGNPVNALLKPQKDGDEEESLEETTEEKVKAYGILTSYALLFLIPLTVFAAVLLGIWTPGTDLDIGASKNSPYRSMGAISRFDEAMDQQRRDYENRGEREY
ncbi:unnamed protein product [Symbiodinium pilosum]|uniref:Uncharacterized protein n=1 Tax=Symbiodinium pilosum TaxID=2952 RepID=A0A812Y7W3_SYMPI|nr:unnamed protein product [Symbiodinium pilosum]